MSTSISTNIKELVRLEERELSSDQKENLLRWADALESGEYAQGTGTLHRRSNNTYCCLGVAAKVAPDEVLQACGTQRRPMTGGQIDRGLELVEGDETWSNFLTDGLGQLHGLDVGTQSRIARLNDEGQITFEEIASAVRGYVETGVLELPQ